MKRSFLWAGLAVAAIAGLNFLVLRPRGMPAEPVALAAAASDTTVAAGPGLVEPLSEEIRMSAQIGGRLERVLADEGDRVRAGQVLAIVDNRDYRARVESAKAELGVRNADRRRISTALARRSASAWPPS